MQFIYNLKNNKGFTLIEMIAGIALFLFIVATSLGIFISIIQNQKKILTEQQFLNQISYIEEYMSKALRMAKTEGDTGACLPPGYIYLLTRENNGIYNGIKFINQSDNNACQEFFLDRGILKELKNSINDENAVALTSINIQINDMRFAINGGNGTVVGQGCSGNPAMCGASNADQNQPRVTILLNVKIPNDSQQPNRIIQTTVSQRNLNVK